MKKALLLLFVCFTWISVNAQLTFFQDVASQMGGVRDWSDSAKVVWPEPSKAFLNISGVSKMPQSKENPQYIDMHAWIEVYDGNGNYFKKRILLNGQGATSMTYPKKNFAVDFCEDEWIGDATTDITIGDWVTQDAFHFKAFYNDYFKGLGVVGYKLYDYITEDRPSFAERAGIKESSNAKYHPDAFPCIVYLNNEFYGVFAWQLKKHRKNMNQEKGAAENIHIDGDLRDDYIFRGNIDWTKFEIRNPKTLFCVDTEVTPEVKAYSKVSDVEKEEVEASGNFTETASKPSDLTTEQIADMFGENPPTYLKYKKNGNIFKLIITPAGLNYVEYNGDKPKELIDSDMPYFNPSNKNHVLTDKVKRYILAMSKYWDELNQLEESGADESTMRAAIEERYDVISLVDYYLHLKITYNNDGILKNWQWFTYDGIKWFVTPYDLDQTHGMILSGGTLFPADYWEYITTSGPLYWIQRYYVNDLTQRYKEIRESGALTEGSWASLVNNWFVRIGKNYFDAEAAKWPESPCYRETICAENWTTDESLWGSYGKCASYSNDVTYNEGDLCKILQKVWKATGTTTGVRPYIFNGYIDSPERVENWIATRLSYLDKKLARENDVPETYTLSISNAGNSTICVPFDFTTANNLHLYTIEDINDEDVLVLSECSFSEAYRPYLIFGDPGQYVLMGQSVEAEPESPMYLVNGLLVGTLENTYAPKDSYVLQNKNNNVGFYHVAEDGKMMVAKNRAYMTMAPVSLHAKARNFSFDSETNAIINTFAEPTGKTPGIYDLNGVRQSTLTKGINVIIDENGNAVKVLVK